MGKWRTTIKIKDAIGEDTSADGIMNAASAIIDRLAGTGAPYAKIEKARDIAKHDTDTALLVFNDGLDRLYRPKALDTPVLVARDAPISMINPRSFGAFASEQNDAATSEAQPVLLADGTVQVAPNGTAVPQVVEQIPGQVQLVAVRPAWVRVSAADGTSVFEGILDDHFEEFIVKENFEFKKE